MKKNILALAIGGILSAGAQAGINDIIITEYVEGGGNNKAVELTNTGTTSYTFAETDVITYSSYSNAIYNATKTNILQGITIAAKETIVLTNGESGAELLAAIAANGAKHYMAGTYSEASNNAMNFNGDDHVALRTGGPKGTIVDNIGHDGDKWGADQTLRRRYAGENNEIPSPNPGDDLNEWESLPKDTYIDLGLATYSDFVVPPPPSQCASDPQTTISEIQGKGHKSPLITDGYETEEKYNVTGIVSAVVSHPKKGFFLAAVEPDGDPLTSDGIFVSSSKATADMVGNTVCVTSIVKENYDETQLVASEWDLVADTSSVPAAVDLAVMPEDLGLFSNTMERFEGMLVNLPTDLNAAESGKQDMRVSRPFGFNFDGYSNNMTVSYKRPNMQPNQNYVAGSAESQEYAAQNADYRLLIESSTKAANGNIPYYPEFNANPADNYIRINDTATNIEGVIGYGYGKYTLIVTNELTNNNFDHNTPRTKKPSLNTSTTEDSFAITIGTQNVLNLFNSPFGGAANQHGNNRGADNYLEFERQQAKLVEAIQGLDADIVGLMEIENNGFGGTGAIAEFVAAINMYYDEEDPSDVDEPNSISNRYVFIGFDRNGDTILDDLDSLGSDAITSGMIYRPSKVTLEQSTVIPMPQQRAPAIVNDNNIVVKNTKGEVLESGSNYHRDALAATFVVNQTGKRLTVAVNHFKSKGSTCYEEWEGVEFGTEEVWKGKPIDTDFQGSCENFRVAGAVQLAEELAKISTRLGSESVIVGDLNSYALEDAMLVLTNNATGKTLTTASHTFIGKRPQYTGPTNITKSYGYVNAVSKIDKLKNNLSWSYSYNDEIGSLDHILISSSLDARLLDATDWHINAAESSLFDYNIDRKGVNTADDQASADRFYGDEATAYRSSDHDSAIIALSYKHGETDGKPVHLVLNSGIMDVPYHIPAAANAKAGDKVVISLKRSGSNNKVDMSMIVLPTIALSKDAQTFINLEVYGAKASTYTATMKLMRDGSDVAGSTISMPITVAKVGSLIPEVAIPQHDETGGSFSIFGLLSLLGLGFLRRQAK